MANSAFRSLRGRREPLDPGSLVPAQWADEPDGPDAARSAPAPRDERPRGFRELAQAAADTAQVTLAVDHVLVLRVFGDRITCLVASPDPELRFSRRLEPAAGNGPPSENEILQAAVQEVATAFGTVGSGGAGLYTRDGILIGVVVAVQREPFADPAGAGTVLRRNADVIGQLLERELADVAVQRQADAKAVAGFTDSFSKMPDRRAWGLLVRHEEARARNLGHPAAIMVVDAGLTNSSRTLRRIIDALRESAGSAPALCRLDARLWGVIVTGHRRSDLAGMAEDLAQDLAEAGGRPAIGVAERAVDGDLADAWSLADERMFSARRERQAVVTEG